MALIHRLSLIRIDCLIGARDLEQQRGNREWCVVDARLMTGKARRAIVEQGFRLRNIGMGRQWCRPHVSR